MLSFLFFLCYSRLKLFRWLLNISVKSSRDTHRQWQKACVNPLTNSAKMCPKSEEHLYSVQRLKRGDGNSSYLVWKSNWKNGQGSTISSPTPLPLWVQRFHLSLQSDMMYWQISKGMYFGHDVFCLFEARTSRTCSCWSVHHVKYNTTAESLCCSYNIPPLALQSLSKKLRANQVVNVTQPMHNILNNPLKCIPSKFQHFIHGQLLKRAN